MNMSTTTATTFDWLCNALTRDYQISAERLQPQTALEDIGLDSLALAELLFTVEDAFRIVVPPEFERLTTLGDVVAYIDGLVAAQAGARPPPAASPWPEKS